MEIVFDSSTLILTAKIGILRELTRELKIIIPEIVKTECISKETLDAQLISTLIKEKKITVRKMSKTKSINKIQEDFRIEAGEAEALSLSLSLNYPLAVDDGPTIKACKILDIKFLTAIHLLLNLVYRNRLGRQIGEVKLEKLSIYGRYSRRIIEEAARSLKGEG